MPRVRDLTGYLVVGAIASPSIIVMSLYHEYNYYENRAAYKDSPKDER